MSNSCILKELGEKIRIKRLTKHLSLDTLSIMFEGSSAHLSRIERGQIDPSLTTLIRIAKALNCSVVELLPEETLLAKK